MDNTMILDQQKLDLAMASKCYNLTLLSKKSSVAYVSILKLKSNKMRLTPRTLGKLAKALNVQPIDLIKLEDEDD